MFIRQLKTKLGEILLQITHLNPEQLKEALITQAREYPARAIGEILVEKGYLSKEDVEAALGVQQGYPYISVNNYKIESHLLKRVPSELMWKFSFIPLDMLMNVLTIAVYSLNNKSAIIEELKNYKVRIFISSHKEITEALNTHLWIK